jgi:hypothetical protein
MGQVIVLAQCGLPVPCEKGNINTFYKSFSTSLIPQEETDALSHFFA